MRFLLIDRITELEPQKSITALKNLSLAEEYLADHFPGFPVMPGVLMLETLIQAGGWLMRHADNFAYSTVMLKEVRAIRYNNFVTPGNTLIVKMAVRKQAGTTWEFNGSGTVNGDSAVSAKLTLEAFNLRDQNPSLADSDALRIQTYRDIFQQIWTPPQA
ncbi:MULTISPECIES: 3-hydroxyacyl-ACP dehydratase FabZ family protein [unclassified Schlesneria]|uniref:3-hydroxyacyl-ACP dehydratase FabZ family protein n=1 Tax=Schlesneria TaxID=656899 RepID=UPI002EE444F3